MFAWPSGRCSRLGGPKGPALRLGSRFAKDESLAAADRELDACNPRASVDRVDEMVIEIALEGVQEKGRAKGVGWELTYANGNGYLWAIYGKAGAGKEIVLTMHGIPGSSPVACCATEWDAMNSRPVITDAIIELRSVQRSSGTVRIVAFNRSNDDRHVIMGVTFPVGNRG